MIEQEEKQPDLTNYLQRIVANEPLTAGDLERAFDTITSGHASNEQIAGLLMGLAGRGETVEEILGAVRSLRKKAVPIDAPENAIDCCGTGGDGAHTLNISTAVSFVVAGCGVPVAKHGNRASSSKSGAADVLTALGVNIDAPHTVMHKALWQHNICFLMATKHHPAARHAAPVRQALGVRTMFNLLGPLLNPANTRRQLIGVYDEKWTEPVAHVLKRLGSEFAWIVNGEGLDEITTTGVTTVTELNDRGEIDTFEIHPHEFGIGLYTRDDIRGGDAAYNAEQLRDLLEGGQGPYHDIVVMNAGAALFVAGETDSMKDGVDLATSCIEDGRALESLETLIEITNSDQAA